MNALVHWESDGDGRVMRPGVISLAAVDGQSMTIGVTRLEPGHVEKPHAHDNEQIACILAGQIEFTVAGDKVLMGPGDILVIPPGVIHSGRCVGDEPVINLDAWHPLRVPGS